MDNAMRCPQIRLANAFHQLIFDQLGNPLVQNAVMSPRIKKCQKEELWIDTCRPKLNVYTRQRFHDPRTGVQVRRPAGSKRLLWAQQEIVEITQCSEPEQSEADSWAGSSPSAPPEIQTFRPPRCPGERPTCHARTPADCSTSETPPPCSSAPARRGRSVLSRGCRRCSRPSRHGRARGTPTWPPPQADGRCGSAPR